MGLGGSGAGGGSGGNVAVCGTLNSRRVRDALTGSGIVTYGANSYGIFAQSVGGGGGSGGSVVTAATS